jgi:hypothetical protein
MTTVSEIRNKYQIRDSDVRFDTLIYHGGTSKFMYPRNIDFAIDVTVTHQHLLKSSFTETTTA